MPDINGGNPAEDKRIIARVEAKRLVGPPGFEFPGDSLPGLPGYEPYAGRGPRALCRAKLRAPMLMNIAV